MSARCGIPQSKIKDFCQLPLAREPLGCSDEAPLAKGGCLGTAEAGGFLRLASFHIGLYFWKVPAVNPSVASGASSLWQGSLFAPGIVPLCDTGLFPSSNRQRGKEAPQKPQPKTGAVAKTYHPSQSEGSISRWLGGILKGKTPNGSELFSP